MIKCARMPYRLSDHKYGGRKSIRVDSVYVSAPGNEARGGEGRGG